VGVELNIPVNPRNGRKQGPYNVELFREVRWVLRMAEIIQEDNYKV
jgi:hypothetical protein